MLNSGLRYQVTLKVLCPNPLTSNFGHPFLHINIHTTRISSEHLSSILSVILNQSFTLGFCAVNIKGRKTSFLMRTTLKLNRHISHSCPAVYPFFASSFPYFPFLLKEMSNYLIAVSCINVVCHVTCKMSRNIDHVYDGVSI